MNNIAVRAEGLSKQYYIGSNKLVYNNLRDYLAGAFKRPLYIGRKSDKQATGFDGPTIWALKDVSFEVKRGEILGIIGRNGAGKTTLLKILSRITKPTKGIAEIYGRVGSLLEVGTGFHEELTGMENIYFNGAILGMKKREMNKNFDQIVDFAGIGRFLHTPIKRYSSGMAVRLAFAIAAHLETEILLVDEVLAVGDIKFQKKCFEKMSGVIKEGRTVLFVSHNMAAINSLCNSVMLLDNGKLIMTGDKGAVINRYIESIYRLTQTQLSDRIDRQGDGKLRFVEYWLEDNAGKGLRVLRSGHDAVIAVRYIAKSGVKLNNVSVAFALYDHLGGPITDLANRISSRPWSEIPSAGVIRCHIPKLPLAPGSYTFNVFSEVNGFIADWIQDAGRLEVEAGDFFASGRLPDSSQGNILIDNNWSIA